MAQDQALLVLLCAPQALYAVNKHANTFEVAETKVEEADWSRVSAPAP